MFLLIFGFYKQNLKTFLLYMQYPFCVLSYMYMYSVHVHVCLCQLYYKLPPPPPPIVCLNNPSFILHVASP